jgi:hypothetical protein
LRLGALRKAINLALFSTRFFSGKMHNVLYIKFHIGKKHDLISGFGTK